MEVELRRCIICTIPKPIAAFNKEHVIPEAIGGRVVIYHVCIDCNSTLGEQADHHLTDNLLIRMFRSEHQIGGAPNPFPEGRLIDDPRQIVYTEVKDGVFVPRIRVQKN
ncbi:HNH endonuclease [Paenibacillus rhizoplanae]